MLSSLLYHSFSDASVTLTNRWSFGVLVWEVFSLGETPAPNITVGELVNAHRNGFQLLTRPEFADDELYAALIKPCWNHRPMDRPLFSDILDYLTKKL